MEPLAGFEPAFTYIQVKATFVYNKFICFANNARNPSIVKINFAIALVPPLIITKFIKSGKLMVNALYAIKLFPVD
jgi:hypothetical protein